MAPSDDAAFANALPSGTEVQGYRVDSVLGAGGFGVTYLAEHAAIGNQVALKEFLPSGIAARGKDGVMVRPVSPAQKDDFAWGLARFREEARTLGKLRHPAIVPVLNFFEANGTAYCVMEYIAGATLDARLGARGTLPAAELAQILPPLLAGIEAVHAAGFLHRDIKPANILLREDGAPVLIDFGAARQALGAHSRSLTAILSEGYAPYEQYQTDGEQGPWTDIYALGATLYRCVSGQKPPEATRRVEARIKSKPDPLRPAAEARAGRYPPSLLAAIDRALGVMESERPQSIAELRSLIETAGGDGTLAADAAPPERPRHEAATMLAGAPAASDRSSRKRRWPLAVAASVAVLVAGGAVAGYIILDERRAKERREAALAAADTERKAAEEEARRQAEEARRKAQEEERRKRREAEEAEQRRQAEERRKAEEERKRRETEEAQRKQREEEARRAEEARQIEAKRKSALEERERGRDALRRRDHDAAIRHFTTAIESKALTREEAAAAYNTRGSAYLRRPDYDRALADFNESIRLDDRVWWPHANRGIVWEAKGDIDRAIADYSAAIRLGAKDAHLHLRRGQVWEKKGDKNAAIADYRAALSLNGNYEPARAALKRLGVTP